MTEADWQTSDDPQAMLAFLRDRLSPRKLRLFACAVARRLPSLGDPALDRERAAVVAVAERFADGQATAAELVAAAECSAGDWFWSIAYPNAFEAAEVATRDDQLTDPPATLAALLRDLTGDPFYPPQPAAIWRTPAARALAAAAYDGHDPTLLPVLADALEEAGCTDAALLDHLRGPGPHVRGCWAVDRLLGKD